ncbi:MAG TPA: hypothetical protein DDW85_05830 [Porphyromonadaceae bacterium]|nr:hypothetical protein [Porphyromonadaceae bacterium]
MYRIKYSKDAYIDMQRLSDVIMYTYKMPKTAESYATQTSSFFQAYGNNVRRLNYKKMAIIYTTNNHIVHIHRIIPANMIIDL